MSENNDPKYGPHNFLVPVEALSGTVTKARCQCGAEICYDSKSGKYIITPAPDPLEDHELCRLNIIQEPKQQITEDTETLEYWQRSYNRLADMLKNIEQENRDLRSIIETQSKKLNFISKPDKEKWKILQMSSDLLRREEMTRIEICQAIKKQMDGLLRKEGEEYT